MARRPNRNTTLKYLRDGVCEVKFTKIDGTERLMRCTLNETLIPRNMMPSAGEADYNERNQNNECRVFDVDIQQWRAFRFDRLISATAKETVA